MAKLRTICNGKQKMCLCIPKIMWRTLKIIYLNGYKNFFLWDIIKQLAAEGNFDLREFNRKNLGENRMKIIGILLIRHHN